MERSNRQLLARIWRPLLTQFNHTIERACLRRDAYLDHVFAHEAKKLKDEIPRPNSSEAVDFLQGRLEGLDRVPVNFSLSPATIEAVNRSCDELNVIRDCFINRVLFLLIADVNRCEAITGIEIRKHLPDILGDNARDFLYTPLWGGSLDAVSGIVSSDPFEALRNVIEYLQDQGDEDVERLHACVIRPELFSNTPPGVFALNCYLSDLDIPDSLASKRAIESAMEALDALLGKSIPGNPREPKPINEMKESPK